MAEPTIPADVKPRTLARQFALGLVPSFLVVAAMIVAYVLLPAADGSGSPMLVVLFGIVMLLAYLGLLSFSVLRLRRSHQPIIDGILLVTVMTTLMILSFSWAYLGMTAADATSFTEPLTKSTAVYFTVTVLSTVGFGDITPVTDTARMMVTAQMLLGITLLSVGVRVIVMSARTARQKRN